METSTRERIASGNDKVPNVAENTSMVENNPKKTTRYSNQKRSLEKQTDDHSTPAKQTKTTNVREVTDSVQSKNQRRNEIMSDEEGNAGEGNSEVDGHGKVGFDNGDVPEKILGSTYARGFLEFLMKWKGQDKDTMVKAKIANQKCPQVVILFYESCTPKKFSSVDK